jgi:hypothetical protein
MARLKLHYKVIATIIVTLVLASCTTLIDWDNQIDTLINGQSYVIPIGESTITLNDILQQFDTLEFIDADDNSIFVKFNDTITWSFRDIIDLDNLVSINETYSVPAGVIPANQTVSAPDFNHVVNLDFNSVVAGQQIVTTEMNSAKIEIKVSTQTLNVDPANIRVTTLFQSNELVFAPGGDASKGAGSSIVFKPTVFNTTEVVTLNPFTLFTPNNLSSLNITVRVEVIAGNTPIVTLPTSKVLITYRLFDLDTKVYYGKIKPVIANEEQGKVVEMSHYIMQLPSRGVFKIAEPIIKFDLYNNSGVKINLALDSIKAYKSDDPAFTPIYALFNGQKSTSKIIDRIPTFGGVPVKSTFILDHTLANGDISHFFDRFPLPDRLFYKFKITNARVDTDPLDFATSDANLTAHIDVKIPLKLNAGSNFEFRDTLENIDLGSLIDVNIIDQMQLILKVTNNLPLKGKLSLSFLDAAMQPITGLKLLADSLITAPQIDENGLVIPNTSAVSDLKITIAESQLDKLKLTKSISFKIKVESDENRKITLQKENYIKLKLGKYSKGE